MKKYHAGDINIIKDKIFARDNRFDVRIQDNTVIAVYLPYNLEFVYIPGGIYNKGLSFEERQQAREINPAIVFDEDEMVCENNVEVSDFLITRTPVLNSFAGRYMKRDCFYGEDFFTAYLKRMKWICYAISSILDCQRKQSGNIRSEPVARSCLRLEKNYRVKSSWKNG